MVATGLIYNKNRIPISKNTILEPHQKGSNPFAAHLECNSKSNAPKIIAHHLHGMFDGTDADSIAFAYSLYHSFITDFDPQMKACAFSHSYPNAEQTNICYFPCTFTENDILPLPTNHVWSSTNYAFFIPSTKMETALKWWTKATAKKSISNSKMELFFNFVFHSVSGCQWNDHTLWTMDDGSWNTERFNTQNLLCCGNGPSLCTCNVVQYEIDIALNERQCLTLDYDTFDTPFIPFSCETPAEKGAGSWKEIIYNRNKGWMQIEAYDDTKNGEYSPTYMCLGIDSDIEHMCEENNAISLIDCSIDAEIGDVWIADRTAFYFNLESKQLQSLKCQEMCVHISLESDGEAMDLQLRECLYASKLIRHWFP